MRVLLALLASTVCVAPSLEAQAPDDTAVQPDIAIIEVFGVDRPIQPMKPTPVFHFAGATFRAEWRLYDTRWTLQGRVDGCAVTGSVEKVHESTRHAYPLEGEYSTSGRLDLWVISPEEAASIIYFRAIGQVFRFRFSRIAVGDGCGTPVVEAPTSVPGPEPIAVAPADATLNTNTDPGPEETAFPGGVPVPEGAARATRPTRAAAAPAGVRLRDADKPTDPRVGAFEDDDGHRGEDSPWSVPVSAGSAAGAGVAVALTSLLGALWMFGTSGLSPGELLGPAPDADLSEPPPAEAPPPPELFVESHRDGEVRPETGEVWSESVGGWVGANYHEIERRAQAEVRRAQGVSDRESRRESTRMAEELRASRQREADAARRGAQAAEEAVWLEAPTIEPYRPGWTDHLTKGLEWAEWGTDTSISVLGSLTGTAGETGARVYTVAKETVKGLSEGVADYVRGKGGHVVEDGSAWVILERGTIGATKGAAKVGLDKLTGDLMNGVGDKLAESAATQGARALVRKVVDQLDSPAAVETCRSVGVAVGKTLAGSEMAAPVNAGIEGLTGEKM